MKELVRTLDPIEVSWLQEVLAEAGIESWAMDKYTAGTFAGISQVLVRLMVHDSDYKEALAVINNARNTLDD